MSYTIDESIYDLERNLERERIIEQEHSGELCLRRVEGGHIWVDKGLALKDVTGFDILHSNVESLKTPVVWPYRELSGGARVYFHTPQSIALLLMHLQQSPGEYAAATNFIKEIVSGTHKNKGT